MFYLVSFLSLLISLLVYMMDPAPVQLRRDLDTRSGEAYVVSFVAQHQAARDYLNQWMGRIDYNNDKIEELAGVSVPVTREKGASALALPAEMESSLPLQTSDAFTSERWTLLSGSNPDGIGYLKFQTDGDQKGSYLSALVCLKDDDLSPCYQYVCDNAGTITISAPGGAVGASPCASGETLVGVKFADRVHPYVVTYSDNAGDPLWWSEKGKPRPLMLELWRRALANRTHSTYNCGVLSEALSKCGSPDGHWKKLGKGKIEWQSGAANATLADESRYCINNGNRCMRLLPKGMEKFLTLMVSNDTVICSDGHSESDKSLAGVFFCASEIKNPYDRIVVPDWHFDGIDNQAFGANTRWNESAEGTKTWRSTGNQGLGKEVSWENGVWGVADYGIGPQFARGAPAGGIVMPFRYTENFTLTVVMNLGRATGLSGHWYISGLEDTSSATFGAPRGDVGMYITNENKMHFCPNKGMCFWIRGRDTDEMTYLLTGVHSWTIVRDGGKIRLYHNDENVGDALGMTWDAEPGASNGNIVIGRVQIGIGNVRYYSRPLSDFEIKRNFEVDAKRYGIQQYPKDDFNWDNSI